MDIVMPPFINPSTSLPTIPTVGFVDQFNRPAAGALGRTDNDKPWRTMDPGTTSSTWGTTGEGTGGMLDSTTQHHFAVVDSGDINGTLSATLASFDDANNRRFGLAMSVVDTDNYITIAPSANADHRIQVLQVADSSIVHLGDNGPELTVGDELSVTLTGTDLTVRVNGVHMLSEQLETTPESSLHGLFGFYQSIATWDYIRFEP